MLWRVEWNIRHPHRTLFAVEVYAKTEQEAIELVSELTGTRSDRLVAFMAE